jgi:capsular exopolysaccharide synthesis family protein
MTTAEKVSRRSNEQFSLRAIAEEIDLEESLRVLWRRRAVIAATVAVVTLSTLAYVLMVPARYTSELQILFESKVGPVFDLKAAVADQPQDEASILSEIEVIRSRGLAGRAIERLGLDRNPEFNEELRGPGAVERVLRVTGIGDALGISFTGAPAADGDKTRAHFREQRMIDAFLARLQARQVPRSRAVAIRFTAADPDVAATALNTLAELYLVARLEDRFTNAQRASGWLAAQVQRLREKVEETERAVEDYRRTHGLFSGERVGLINEQVSGLSAKLTDATIARRALEANLGQVRRLLDGTDEIDSVSQVLQSSLVQRFREEEAELERKEAEYGQKFGPRHPQMIQLQAEKNRFRQKINSEIGKIVRGMENDLQIARKRESSLAHDLNNLKSEMAQANQASVGLHMLQRDAEANRLLLDKFLNAFMETSAQEDVQSQLPDARIISPAPIPEHASFPNEGLFLALAFIGATVGGVLLAFMFEYLDAGFRSAEQIEHATGLPVMAHVPLVAAVRGGGDDIAAYVLKRKESAYAEAIRSIHTRLSLTFARQTPKVIAFVSADAGEGKSTIALSLARQQVAAGRRVIIVDTDFRRTRIASRIPGINDGPGLSEVLKGTAGPRDAIQSDPRSAADIVVAGREPFENFDLGDAAKLEAFLKCLGDGFGARDGYDLIVLDAPPLLAVSDAQLIAGVADATLMVVRWGKTRRRVVQYAIEQATRFGGRIDGIVLSMVDVKKHAYYGYGDSGYYYGKAANYYRG